MINSKCDINCFTELKRKISNIKQYFMLDQLVLEYKKFVITAYLLLQVSLTTWYNMDNITYILPVPFLWWTTVSHLNCGFCDLDEKPKATIPIFLPFTFTVV